MTPENSASISDILVRSRLRANVFLLLLCQFCLLSPTVSLAAELPTEQGSSLGVLEDFDSQRVGPYQKGFLDTWRWTEEVRARAREQSLLEVVQTSHSESHCLRVGIDDPKLLDDEALSILRLTPHFPPEADAVRIRLRVLTGQAVIYVGGPTAYYGNSDVYTEPLTVVAADKPEWVDVVCRLNHPTWRNFRRSGFSTEAPRNYYTRWAQEPIGLFVAAGTQGEFLIDRIDLVALGEGQPFAQFTPEQIQQIKTIADFESGDLKETFNLYMADGETEWFEQSWKREKTLRFTPMQLSVIEDGFDGTRSLSCTGQTAEEVHCTGVKTSGTAGANAFSLTISVDAPEQRNTLVGSGPTVPIDFLVFVAPANPPFPWQKFAPAAELQAHPGPGFDFQFSYRTIRNDNDVDFAIYQTRRYLKPSEWTKLVLPVADFTCVYGQGRYRARLIDHEPLTCDDVIAFTWLNPWCRAGQGNSTLTTQIDNLAFVRVPGTPAEHRSFWQVPNVKQLQYRESTARRGRLLHIALPDE